MKEYTYRDFRVVIHERGDAYAHIKINAPDVPHHLAGFKSRVKTKSLFISINRFLNGKTRICAYYTYESNFIDETYGVSHGLNTIEAGVDKAIERLREIQDHYRL